MFNQLRYFFAIVLCNFFLVTICVAEKESLLQQTLQSQDVSQGLLWRISKQGQEDSYLLGTMHSEDERILALVDQVSSKINNVHCLALELDLNPANAAKVMQAMFFTGGSNVKQLVSDDIYNTLIALFKSEHGLGESQVSAMKPWALMMLLSAPKAKTGIFLDRALYLLAIEKNHKIVGLETVEEQIAVMDNMDVADQVALLENAVATYGQMPEMFESLVGAYLNQDLAEMENLYDAYTRGSDARLVDMLTERLLTMRNNLMVNRMIKLFSHQPCFAAVGALHLPGDDGLVNKLTNAGYSAVPVKLDF